MSDYPKIMFVSDFGCDNEERIVLGCFNGQYVAVSEEDEERYANGEPFETSCWEYAEDIPDKKVRPLTHAEVFHNLVGKYLFGAGDGVYSEWNTLAGVKNWKCIKIEDYTGTDADKWLPLDSSLLEGEQ